jgi:hypothetical protein
MVSMSVTTPVEIARTPRTLGLAAVIGVLPLGCLGPNPLLDAGESNGDTTETGDGDGDGDAPADPRVAARGAAAP